MLCSAQKLALYLLKNHKKLSLLDKSSNMWCMWELCRLETLNEKRGSMVQRVKIAEKEKDGLEVSRLKEVASKYTFASTF